MSGGDIRVDVDGENFSGHYRDVTFASKWLEYDLTVPEDTARYRGLGPQGFQIAFTAPSTQLRTLLCDGREHRFTVRVSGQMLQDTAVLQRECAYGGVTVLMCCRPADDASAKWVDDPLAH